MLKEDPDSGDTWLKEVMSLGQQPLACCIFLKAKRLSNMFSFLSAKLPTTQRDLPTRPRLACPHVEAARAEGPMGTVTAPATCTSENSSALASGRLEGTRG